MTFATLKVTYLDNKSDFCHSNDINFSLNMSHFSLNLSSVKYFSMFVCNVVTKCKSGDVGGRLHL